MSVQVRVVVREVIGAGTGHTDAGIAIRIYNVICDRVVIARIL